MKIFLVRHGFNDFDCGEASRGKEQAKAAGAFFAWLLPDVTKTMILTSPISRAVETAAILLKHLRISQLQEVEWLCLDESTSFAIGALDRFISLVLQQGNDNNKIENIILVSHEPNIENLIAWFARDFGFRTECTVGNASVHLIDRENRKILKLFQP